MWMLAAILWFFVFEFMGYLLHCFMHVKGTGVYNRIHTAHHVLYTPEDFLSKKYRYVGKYDTILLFTPFFILAGLTMFMVFSWVVALFCLAELSLVSWLNDRAHYYVHVSPNKLEKFGWFRKMREYHLKHHVEETSNYGVLSSIWDRVFKTKNINA
jgi:sterol desaturase/sphingolipid hydroxylase (fatty acid hydroxylase superfamily)